MEAQIPYRRAGDSELDALVVDALRDFTADVHGRTWLAKEHECVNRFVLRHLAARVGLGNVLHDLAQLRVEGGVPKPPGVGKRPSSRKDVVIWPDADATCWIDEHGDGSWVPHRTPLAVMEWKADLRGRKRPQLSIYDLTWLGAAARHWPDFTGYAVLLHRDALIAAGCRGDAVDLEWLHVAKPAGASAPKESVDPAEDGAAPASAAPPRSR